MASPVFIDDACGVFDCMDLYSTIAAETALCRNGFTRHRFDSWLRTMAHDRRTEQLRVRMARFTLAQGSSGDLEQTARPKSPADADRWRFAHGSAGIESQRPDELAPTTYSASSLVGAGKANRPSFGGNARLKCLRNSSQSSDIRSSVVTEVICLVRCGSPTSSVKRR